MELIEEWQDNQIGNDGQSVASGSSRSSDRWSCQSGAGCQRRFKKYEKKIEIFQGFQKKDN